LIRTEFHAHEKKMATNGCSETADGQSPFSFTLLVAQVRQAVSMEGREE
jgi:hypothetical protein